MSVDDQRLMLVCVCNLGSDSAGLLPVFVFVLFFNCPFAIHHDVSNPNVLLFYDIPCPVCVCVRDRRPGGGLPLVICGF